MTGMNRKQRILAYVGTTCGAMAMFWVIVGAKIAAKIIGVEQLSSVFVWTPSIALLALFIFTIYAARKAAD